MVIPVCVAKGGAGKSTLTLNLAVYLALRLWSQGRTVCVVDANFQQADIGNLINTYTPTIVDLARRPADLTPDAIRRHMVHVEVLHTSFLLGPALTEEANPQWITPGLYRAAVDALRPLYDYIFIDTPVAEYHHDLFTDFILPSSDFMVVPVNPDYRAISNTDRWLRSITQPTHAGGMGTDPNRFGVVLNKAAADVACDEDQVRVELSSWHYIGAIPDSREWQRAANQDEIIATRNLPDISEALAKILYAVTGEEALKLVGAGGSRRAAGPLGKLFSRFASSKG
jgi:MinD-like ATPase involved in chromosome partitioning or flagellar assembly